MLPKKKARRVAKSESGGVSDADDSEEFLRESLSVIGSSSDGSASGGPRRRMCYLSGVKHFPICRSDAVVCVLMRHLCMQSRKLSGQSGKGQKQHRGQGKKLGHRKKKKKKARDKQSKACDLCSSLVCDPDPVNPEDPYRWARTNRDRTSFYDCRRLYRFDVRNAKLSLA